MDRTLVIARMWGEKTLQQYVMLHQIQKEFWDFNLEIHLLIDNYVKTDEWTEKINTLPELHEHFPLRILFYKIPQLDNWLKKEGVSVDMISNFKNFKHIYQILFYYYLWKEHNIQYMVTFDDDIMINGNLDRIDDLIIKQIPWVIDEKNNPISDKSLLIKLSNYFHQDLTKRYYYNNPYGYGCNAGFMGINLKTIFKPLSDHMFIHLFNYNKPNLRDKVTQELWLTQEQSFFSIMMHCFSVNKIIRLNDGYMSSDVPLETCMDSKILHFTGDRKHSPLFKLMLNDYIEKNGTER